MTISNGVITVTIHPEKLDPKPLSNKVRNETLTGRVYSKTRKVRMSWRISSVVNEADKLSLETLLAEDYVTANILGTDYDCIFDVDSFSALRLWGDKAYKTSFTLEERGW